MSEVKEFFRICPSCGRRFHIRLVGEKLVDERKDSEKVKQAFASGASMGYGAPMVPIVVEQDVPITIDVQDFQYTYKCKHCGHQWTEMHEKESED